MHRSTRDATPAPRPPDADPDDRAFLAGYDAERFPRPSVAVDVVLLTVEDRALWTLLVRRAEQPQAGRWALPGGFVRIDESLDAAATRVLAAKAGLEGAFVEQLFTFGAPERDPRTRVISVAHYALVEPERLRRAIAARRGQDLCLARVATPAAPPTPAAAPQAAPPSIPQAAPGALLPGAAALALGPDATTLALAFDHARILGTALARIRGKLDWAPIGFELLPDAFSLRELRLVHEAILGRALNKDSFRRRVLDRRLVVPTGTRATGLGHRPPELYRFVRPARPGADGGPP